MALMSANKIALSSTPTVLAGERLRIQVLNNDGSEKTLVYDEEVPSGKTLAATVNYGGTLS